MRHWPAWSDDSLPLVLGGWRLGLEWCVPPPLGAFAGWAAARCDVRWCSGGWAGQGGAGELLSPPVGDPELIGGSDQGEFPFMVQPVMVGADQHQVAYKARIYPIAGDASGRVPERLVGEQKFALLVSGVNQRTGSRCSLCIARRCTFRLFAAQIGR